MATVVEADVVVCWPSTAASIPSGWTRDTQFDTKFIQGAPAAGDADFSARGNSTHTHTSPAHTPALPSHLHGYNSNTTGDQKTDPGSGVSKGHSHATRGSNSTTPTAQSSTVGFLANSSNDPPFVKVIFIKSNGTPSGIPDGAYAFWGGSTLPSSWGRKQSDKYLKGADASGDGGGTGGASTHTHTSDTHTHLQNPHTHTATSAAGGSAATMDTAFHVSNKAAANTHTHLVTFAATTATCNSTSNTAPASNHEPEYKKLHIVENETGGNDLPLGIVALWGGSAANIPGSWKRYAAMDGKFLKGAGSGEEGNTGGSTTHTHSSVLCTPTQNAHTHSASNGVASATVNVTDFVNASGSDNWNIHSHAHTWSVFNASPGAGFVSYNTDANSAESAYPPYVRPIFIEYTGPAPFVHQLRPRPRRKVRRRALPFDPGAPEAATPLAFAELEPRRRRASSRRPLPFDAGVLDLAAPPTFPELERRPWRRARRRPLPFDAGVLEYTPAVFPELERQRWEHAPRRRLPFDPGDFEPPGPIFFTDYQVAPRRQKSAGAMLRARIRAQLAHNRPGDVEETPGPRVFKKEVGRFVRFELRHKRGINIGRCDK